MKYDVSEYTTKRGSKGLIISVADAPVVSMDFEFRAGYRYGVDFDHKIQVAHVLEHMMCRVNDKLRKSWLSPRTGRAAMPAPVPAI